MDIKVERTRAVAAKSQSPSMDFAITKDADGLPVVNKIAIIAISKSRNPTKTARGIITMARPNVFMKAAVKARPSCPLIRPKSNEEPIVIRERGIAISLI